MNIVEKYGEFPAFLRKPAWQLWHFLINRLDKNDETIFLNYGFSELEDHAKELMLHPEDEKNRYCIQLYHKVATGVPVEGKKALEVGCGRGGGASYIHRYLKTLSYTAIDLSEKVISFCRRSHQIPDLSFGMADAHALPFPDESFDIVINVESARSYRNIALFFSEVKRVLRPGGHFLYADMIRKSLRDKLLGHLAGSGMNILHQENINPNITRALELDNERRQGMIRKLVPSLLTNSFKEFAGTRDTRRYQTFATGEMEYWYFVLGKS